jgi:FO synthase
MISQLGSTRSTLCCILDRTLGGVPLSAADARALLDAKGPDLIALMAAATEMTSTGRAHRRVTYSRKVFLPLTNLCRDRCGYCTFVKDPRQQRAHTMTPDEVLAVAREGVRLGCKEALFSLGDHPELRHPEFLETLQGLGGYGSTPEYVAAMCELVLEETGLLPHTNCGTLSDEELEMLAPWNASMGIMLESASTRLFERGGPHYLATTKAPELRVQTIARAAERGILMTTGLLIGIGETPDERIESLLMIRDVQERCGNIQEVIIQNFRAKPDTLMRHAAEPDTVDMVRTQAVARLLLGPTMNIQSPPNLNDEGCQTYLLAGINDWGGISPVTKDFINPDAAWPAIDRLGRLTSNAGYVLRERLALYPEHATRPPCHVSPALRRQIDAFADAEGFVKPSLERM